MRCFTIGGEKPFQSWLISLHLPKRASSCATLSQSLFKCLIFQLLKQPARLKIPWARWPISSLFSFATILNHREGICLSDYLLKLQSFASKISTKPLQGVFSSLFHKWMVHGGNSWRPLYSLEAGLMQSSNSGMEFGPRLHAPFDFGYAKLTMLSLP